MDELISLLTGRTESPSLDLAALQLATIEFPTLDHKHYQHTLDGYAATLAARLPSAPTGSGFVAAANKFLFEELGFHGNEQDYYNPRNSCLNDVLERKAGIPITLAIVYLEVGRRLRQPVHGIGLPGHFIVQYNDNHFSTYIDVFRGGALLTVERCRELALGVSGLDINHNPAMLHPVSKRQILLRMLNNIRGIYFQRQAYQKALAVLDLLLAATPQSPEEYRQRGFVHAQLQHFGAARTDFETYLRLAPEASDRADVEQQLVRLRLWQSSLN